jgi:hypothetical protein
VYASAPTGISDWNNRRVPPRLRAWRIFLRMKTRRSKKLGTLYRPTSNAGSITCAESVTGFVSVRIAGRPRRSAEVVKNLMGASRGKHSEP